MNSEELFNEAKTVIPSGVNSPVRYFKPYPFYVEEAHGAKIQDVDGNEYIDYCLGYGPLILGHAHPQVKASIAQQIEKGWLYGTPLENEIKLAKIITQDFPSIDKIRFVNSGTEATLSALRLARAYSKKEKIVFFNGCFHGAQDFSLARNDKYTGIPTCLRKLTVEAEFNDLESLRQAIDKETAAVILEPAMGNIGVIPPKEDFLKQVREICDEKDVLLIFDEVITGYRLSEGGAQRYFKVAADITTLGKIIGGGLPIGAYGANEEIMGLVAPTGKMYQSGTFCGNPLSMASGLAALRTIKKEGTIQKASSKAEKIVRALSERFSNNVAINSIESMFQIFFGLDNVDNYADLSNLDKNKFEDFRKSLLSKGVFISPSPFEAWFTSSAHTKEEINETIKAIDSFSA